MRRSRLRVAREGDVADAIKRQSAMYLQRAQAAEARVDELESVLRSIDVGFALTAAEMRDRARAAFDRKEQTP